MDIDSYDYQKKMRGIFRFRK